MICVVDHCFCSAGGVLQLFVVPVYNGAVDISSQLTLVLHEGVANNLLLLLCSDVLSNPGPVRYPCTVCNKSVCSNQRALQCDECQLWSHAGCVHVSSSLYSVLQAKIQFSWQCPSCLFAALPASEVVECGSQSPLKSCDSNSIPLTVEVLEESFSGI